MRNMTIRAGLPALLFSLEMSEAEVQERVVSAEAQVLITDLRTGRVDDAGWEKIGPARDALQDAPLYVDDSPELTMVEIAAKTKLAVKRHGVKLMAVDYLQLLRLGGKADSRQEEVSSISRQLKLLAKSCKIPVIAIAQLNRGVEQRGDDATPRPSDLRESGSLEQDADVVIMIHRPDVLNKDHARAGEADLIVAKHRGGDTGTVTVASQLHYSRFVSMQ
jgi:replicative DNA helicase